MVGSNDLFLVWVLHWYLWSVVMSDDKDSRDARNPKRTNKSGHGRPKLSYKPGTKVYCWKFLSPIVGWVGGDQDDDWQTDKAVIQSRMGHCKHPCELIEETV